MRARAALLGAGLLMATAGSAEAYVRTKTRTGGHPMYWDHSCITVQMNAGDLPPLLDLSTATPAAQAAVGAWSSPALSCSALNLNMIVSNETEGLVQSSTSANPTPNQIIFRRDKWCRQPEDTDEPCYSSSALAITSVFAQVSNGVITSAHIEVNAVKGGFIWGDAATSSTPASIQDLQNVLTHEMGHFVGLDHNCYLPATDSKGNLIPRQTDNLGNSVPDCDTMDPAIRAATMFASADPGDTEKRSLEQDDITGVCSIYPVSVPLTCDPPPPSNGGGCTVAGGRPGLTGLLGFVLALMATMRTVRRRSSGRG